MFISEKLRSENELHQVITKIIPTKFRNEVTM